MERSATHIDECFARRREEETPYRRDETESEVGVALPRGGGRRLVPALPTKNFEKFFSQESLLQRNL